MPPPSLPLAGLLVADLSRVVAGPNVAMVLADLGADVVKVERLGTGDDTRSWGPPWVDDPGDPSGRVSTYYLGVNRGKRSIALDLGDAGDAALARTLIGRSDVLVENFVPGTLERFGLGVDGLRAEFPSLVACTILGFGDTDEAAAMPGYDLLAQAAGGLMSVTGPPDGPPTKVGVAVVDVLASLYATVGVLAALEARHRSGVGDHVKVSLFDSVLAALLNQASAHLLAGVVPDRMGNDHPSITPYSTYAAADRHFVLACGNDTQFAKAAGVVGAPELATDERFATNAARVAHRDELRAELESRLAAEPASEWTRRFTAAGVPAGPVNDIAEAFELGRRLGLDPVTVTRRADDSEVPTVRSPIRLASVDTPGSSAPVPMAPPRLGEHDDELHRWLSDDR